MPRAPSQSPEVPSSCFRHFVPLQCCFSHPTSPFRRQALRKGAPLTSTATPMISAQGCNRRSSFTRRRSSVNSAESHSSQQWKQRPSVVGSRIYCIWGEGYEKTRWEEPWPLKYTAVVALRYLWEWSLGGVSQKRRISSALQHGGLRGTVRWWLWATAFSSSLLLLCSCHCYCYWWHFTGCYLFFLGGGGRILYLFNYLFLKMPTSNLTKGCTRKALGLKVKCIRS